jgi:hypothetical protein
MSKVFLTGCLSAIWLVLVLPKAGQAQVQPYGQAGYSPYQRATLSPYLNMVRGGNPAANYFLGVLPEFNRRANAYQFGAAIQDLDQRVNSISPGPEEDLRIAGTTGHPTAFANTAGYFGTLNMPRVQPFAATPANPAARRIR